MAKEKKFYRTKPNTGEYGASVAKVKEHNMTDDELFNRKADKGFRRQVALLRRQSVEAEKRGDIERADELAKKADDLIAELKSINK